MEWIGVNMNYDKLLESVIGVYKAPKKNLDALQSLFLMSLLVVVPLVFLGHEFSYIPADGILYAFMQILTYGFYLMAFVATVPFAMKVIQQTLKKDEASNLNFLSRLFSSNTLTYVMIVLSLTAFALLVFLPYGTGELLQTMGSSSNILATYTVFLMIAASIAFMYIMTKVIGVIVYAAANKHISMFDMFRMTKGHFLALTILVVATIVPVELVTQFILYGVSGLMKISDNLLYHSLIMLLQAFIRSNALLLQLYLMWTAVAGYMKDNKLIN
jgi:hypothetical protein